MQAARTEVAVERIAWPFEPDDEEIEPELDPEDELDRREEGADDWGNEEIPVAYQA